MSFEAAFYKTMDREGWGKESNHKLDPGKRTFSGISEAYWPYWEGWKLLEAVHNDPTNKDLLNNLMDAVERFYRINFWGRIGGDKLAELSQDIAETVFDVHVNSEKGGIFLQEALNLLNRNKKLYPDLLVDGKIGTATLSTLKIALAQRPPKQEVTEQRICRIIKILLGSQWIDRMRKYPEREEFRGIWDRVE